MKISGYIRAADWWSNKLPTLLSIGYATVLHAGSMLYEIAPYCFLLLLSLIVGAIYVSLINDITDMDIDLANGKKNRMHGIPASVRWVLPVLCLLVGFGFGWFLWPDRLSVLLYFLSWLTFTLYSVPPFRLKTKGWAGAFADACGAHLFPSLYLVSALSYQMGDPVEATWFFAVGIWALMHGLRGILWHQYRDRENDIKTDTKTLATKIPIHNMRSITTVIFVVEVIAFTVMLIWIGEPVTFVFLGFYALSAVLGYHHYRLQPIIVLNPENRPFQIIMQDFYQSFLPFSLLLVAVYHQPWAWIVLIVHLILFPKTLIDIGRNTGAFLLRALKIR